jgi:16S rRNA processing protein RimM
METDSCYKIGWILKPHGLKGELTVLLEADAPDVSSLKTVFIEENQRLVPYFIQQVSAQKSKAFIKLEDVNSIEEAEKISKRAIYIEKSARAKTGRGEFYDDEVIGFEVHDQDKGLLGQIQDVMQAGPNRLLVVKQLDKEILIPINGPFITSINKGKKRVTVNLPDGFLDI